MWPKQTTRAPGLTVSTACAAREMNSGTEAIGTEMSCLIDAPSGFCPSGKFSRNAQKAFAWARLAAITASPAIPLSSASESTVSIRLFASSDERPDEISISTCQGHSPSSGGTKSGMCFLDEIQRRLADQFERGQAGAGLVSARPNRANAASGDFKPAQATSRPFGFGTSFITAAVMMPSVPSAPTNRFFRS